MTDQPDARRLATILSIDIAGFSRASELDEVAAARHVQALRNLVAERAALHKGRIFNTAGDGVMLEFPTVADGVAGALDIADAAREAHKAGMPLIRLGLHVGDVTVLTNGDLIGAGVNVAARVQQRAEPGEVLTTGDVRNIFATQSTAQFTPYGGAQLDKMARQVQLFALARPGAKSRRSFAQRMRQGRSRWVPAVIAVAIALLAATVALYAFPAGEQRTAAARPTGLPVVAVVPFENLSGDESLNFFSVGMTEEIRHAVSRIRGIRVVARDPGSQLDLGGVSHLLSGSVRKNADRVRVSAQLSRAGGEILWSDSFERPIAESVVVQDEIAREVARALSVVAPQSARSATIDPRAFELYLRGRNLWRSGGEGSVTPRAAIADLEEAVRIAPDFARAWVALASAYVQRQNWFVGEEQMALIERARAAATRALELDPKLGEAYTVLGRFNPSPDWAVRGEQFAKAIAAEPNDPDVLLLHSGFWLGEIGQQREAARQLGRAYESDPGSRLLQNRYIQALIAIGDTATVERIIQERSAGDPEIGMLWQALMVEALRRGDFDAARGYRDKFFTVFKSVAADYPDVKVKDAEAQLELIFAALEQKDPAKVDEVLAKMHGELDKGQAAAAQALFDYLLMGRPEIAREILTRLYLEDGYKKETMDSSIPIPASYVYGRVPTAHLMSDYLKDFRRDPLLWRIFATKGLIKYWIDTNQWPDFCSEIGGVQACRAEAEKALAAESLN